MSKDEEGACAEEAEEAEAEAAAAQEEAEQEQNRENELRENGTSGAGGAHQEEEEQEEQHQEEQEAQKREEQEARDEFRRQLKDDDPNELKHKDPLRFYGTGTHQPLTGPKNQSGLNDGEEDGGVSLSQAFAHIIEERGERIEDGTPPTTEDPNVSAERYPGGDRRDEVFADEQQQLETINSVLGQDTDLGDWAGMLVDLQFVGYLSLEAVEVISLVSRSAEVLSNSRAVFIAGGAIGMTEVFIFPFIAGSSVINAWDTLERWSEVIAKSYAVVSLAHGKPMPKPLWGFDEVAWEEGARSVFSHHYDTVYQRSNGDDKLGEWLLALMSVRRKDPEKVLNEIYQSLAKEKFDQPAFPLLSRVIPFLKKHVRGGGGTYHERIKKKRLHIRW